MHNCRGRYADSGVVAANHSRRGRRQHRVTAAARRAPPAAQHDCHHGRSGHPRDSIALSHRHAFLAPKRVQNMRINFGEHKRK